MGLFDLFKRKKRDAVQPELDAGPEATTMPAPVASRMRVALNRTRAFFASAFATDPEGLADDEFYEELEENLVLADIGLQVAGEINGKIRRVMRDQGLVKKSEALKVARQVLQEILDDTSEVKPLQPGQLSVILLVGVNGTGKTTLAAKLANRLRSEGSNTMLVAADTFRAAAVDQLKVWAGRAGVDIVAGQEGADPAAVVFDAAQAARSRGVDVLVVDTAGRLQTKQNLMSELSKLARTVDKACPGANIARILVLDATVGQNAISQAELFNECCALDGLAITKLDGTAKGGAVFAVVDRLKLPVLYMGVGEGIEDILDFDNSSFVTGLLPE